jgi:hypothetical protein
MGQDSDLIHTVGILHAYWTGRGSYPEALNTVCMGQKRDLIQWDGIKEAGDRTGTLSRGAEYYPIGIGQD